MTTEYPSHDFPRELDLQWTLFNSSVITAPAMVLANGRCIEHDLSTYDPHLIWTCQTVITGVTNEEK